MNSRTLAIGGAFASLGILYWLRIRPWHLTWGTTPEEVNGYLPGDERYPEANVRTTHAIAIDAPAEAVWPWLVQVGQERGGFYSYTWFENLLGCRMTNADRIHPEWQHLEPGDIVKLHPSAKEAWLPVTILNPGSDIVLGERGNWSFHLRPAGDGRCRLIVRIRGEYPDPATKRLGPLANFVIWKVIFEPGHFIMERKMLVTVKGLAERQWRATSAPSLVPEPPLAPR